jgi:PAS domain S-box-containing protein
MIDPIGIRIKKIRKSLGWSQSKLGSKLGVTPSAIVYWEQGKRQISMKMLQKLSQVTKKPLSIFYEDSEKVLITESVNSIASKVESLTKLLKETEQKYKQIVETSQEGIVIIDQNSTITFLNQRLADMFGYTVNEMLGKNIFDFRVDKKLPVPTHFISNPFQQIMPHIEMEFYKKDGTFFYVILSISRLINLNGEFQGVLGLFTDISIRKNFEEKLKESESRTKAILFAIPDMLFILDKNGTYIDFKADSSDDLALPPSEIIGKNVREIGLSDNDLKNILNAINSVLKDQKIISLNYSLQVQSGKKTWNARIAPVNNKEVVCVVREITNYK